MLNAIIAGVFKAILGSIGAWFNAKKAKENEYAARSLEAQKASIVEARAVEVKIQDVQVNIKAPETKADLANTLGLSLVFLCLFVLPGCKSIIETKVTVNQNKPTIRTKKPTKEMIEGPDQLTPREKALGQYIGQLRAAVGEYNKWAIESNKVNGYPPGEDAAEGWEVIVPKPVAPVPAPVPVAPPKPEETKAEVVPLPETRPEKPFSSRPG